MRISLSHQEQTSGLQVSFETRYKRSQNGRKTRLWMLSKQQTYLFEVRGGYGHRHNTSCVAAAQGYGRDRSIWLKRSSYHSTRGIEFLMFQEVDTKVIELDRLRRQRSRFPKTFHGTRAWEKRRQSGSQSSHRASSGMVACFSNCSQGTPHRVKTISFSSAVQDSTIGRPLQAPSKEPNPECFRGFPRSDVACQIIRRFYLCYLYMC